MKRQLEMKQLKEKRNREREENEKRAARQREDLLKSLNRGDIRDEFWRFSTRQGQLEQAFQQKLTTQTARLKSLTASSEINPLQQS